MRTAFIQTLTELAAADPRVILLTGDLGFMALEPFSDAFPDRFYNMGVAEQNMVGVATGLAEAGFLPFCYSIAPFAAYRPFEFIRNGPVQHGWPVRIVGVGAGFDYGSAGYSHHGLEDIAIMNALPGLGIVAPADPAQTVTALRATWDQPGPIYYRIGKDDRLVVTGLDGRFTAGGVELLSDGVDCLLIATGPVAVEAVRAAELLNEAGIHAGVAVMASIRPLDEAALAATLTTVPLVVTVEAHAVQGGIGSIVAGVIAERGAPCRLLRRGVSRPPDGVTGSTTWLYRRHGLDAVSLAAAVRQAIVIS